MPVQAYSRARNPFETFLDRVALFLGIGVIASIGVFIADAVFGQTSYCPAPKAFPIVGELPHVDS